MQTTRQQLISLLENSSMSIKELSKALRLKEKEIYPHLTHVERSIKAKKKKLRLMPFQCNTCSFVFKDRKRLTPPGRCPKCKQGSIGDALYWIE